MRRFAKCTTAGLIAAALIPALSASGIERPDWADSGLAIKNGLVLWLDAAAQAAARQAADEGAPLRSGDSVENWFDSSGHGRHVRQSDATARPIIRTDGKLAAMRFDGRGAHLLLKRPGPVLR